MEKEWTIIFLIYADFRKEGMDQVDTDLKREFDHLMRDLEKCRLHKNMEVLMIRNIVNPEALTESEFDTTEVVRIAKGSGRSGSNTFENLEKIPTLRLAQKADDLGDLFNKIHCNKFGKTITRGKRYFLITWGHGSAFGSFRRNLTSRDRGEENPEEIMINFSNQNDTTTSKMLIFQKEVTPVSLQKTNEDDYRQIVRHWENPIYRYFTTERNFLFGLNSRNVKEQFYQKMIADPYLNVDTRIVEKGKKFSIEIPNIHLYNIQAGLASDVLVNKIDIAGIKGTDVLEESSGEVGAGNIPKPNALEVLQPGMDQVRDNILQIDLPVEPNKILDILTNEELQRAISKGFKSSPISAENKNIDVLMMLNCYLMNVHTCYALRDDVDYLVAPQGLISEPGYDYLLLINQIRDSLATPGADIIEAETLSRLCINSCEYVMSNERSAFKDRIEEWAIKAVKLENYERLADKIDDFAGELISSIRKTPDIRFAFEVVRNSCVRFDSSQTNYFMIDLSHWMSESILHLSEKGFDNKLFSNSFISIQDFINDAIISERIGNRVFAGVTDGFLKKRPQAISIYFPEEFFVDQEFSFFIDRNSHNQSSFLKEKKNWLDFISLFLEQEITN